MPTVNPTLDELARFEEETPDATPLVMLNLLRFREIADYGPDGPKDVPGNEAYATYSREVMPLLFEIGGMPLWMAKVRASVIAPAGESWDEVLLVQYPSRAAFLRMVSSPAYQEVMRHRTAALADSRLLETQTVRLPRWVLRVWRAAVRAKALIAPRIRGSRGL